MNLCYLGYFNKFCLRLLERNTTLAVSLIKVKHVATETMSVAIPAFRKKHNKTI